MRIQKIKVLTGTMLSLLISAVSVYPAMARPTGEVESGQIIGQTSPTTSPSDTSPSDTSPSQTSPSQTSPTDNAQTVRGTVKTISGDVVTVQLPDGTTRDITFPKGDVVRLNLKPGTQISATVDDQNVASNVSVIQSNTSGTSSTRTRIEEQEVIRRRTVQTKPARAQTQTTQQRTTAPVQQESTPVRALW